MISKNMMVIGGIRPLLALHILFTFENRRCPAYQFSTSLSDEAFAAQICHQLVAT